MLWIALIIAAVWTIGILECLYERSQGRPRALDICPDCGRIVAVGEVHLCRESV